MGRGYVYKCKKCQNEYTVGFGAGFMYPEEYQSMLKDIASGKYGEEWNDALTNTPGAAINAETVIYICNSCNTWEEGRDITLYAPNNPEITAAAEKLGVVPYVMGSDLKSDYHVIKRYFKKCNKCGKRMHKAVMHETENLCCPKCGAANKANDMFFWD